MNALHVDFQKKVGPMKPVHGVNNGPVTCNFTQDATEYFREAGIPFSRLHDTEYPFGSGEFVDVGCVFPNFDADPSDPANYNFALTDLYLRKILDAGTKIIYRLGSSIEHQPIKRHIHPPKDSLQWARICEGIIRHVNEGWGDGHHMDIQYWEIWNEPELVEGQMWTGTPEQFYELYTVAAAHLKGQYPGLKIGGPAFAGPWKSEFREGFFRYISQRKAPLDFFSWHGYIHTVEEAAQAAQAAREFLDEYGYTGTESIYDEWNYVRNWADCDESWKTGRSLKGAAFDAGVLTALQRGPVDIANYYDAQLKFAGSWCGLFAKAPVRAHAGIHPVQPLKPYYAFKAFGELYRLGTEVLSSIQGEGLYTLAASDGKTGKVLLVNFREEYAVKQSLSLSLEGCAGRIRSYRILDETHNLTDLPVPEGGQLELPAYSVALLEVEL